MEVNGAAMIDGWRRRSGWLCMAIILALGVLLAAPGTAARAAVPNIFTVISMADTGGNCPTPATCTLRQAINAANAASPGPSGINLIVIAATGTITLGSTLPTLVGNVAISGPASGAGVTIDGGHTVQPFVVGSGVTAAISQVTIANGHAASGGGILNNGALYVADTTFVGNSADLGGGIDNTGTLTVNRSTFSGNSGLGGGVRSDATGTVTVTNSTFARNSSWGEGGGIENNNGTLAVTNSTFAGNSAQAGGGIFNAGTLDLTNATLSGNSASGVGGGIYNNQTLHLTNTIVAGNTATRGGPDIGGTNGVTPTTGHNLIGTTSGTMGIANGTNGDIVSATPRLGPLGDNAGPTQTMALLSGSPAIDHGDDTVCSGTGAAGVNNKDQRGAPRPQAHHCDIGAYEATATNSFSGGWNRVRNVNDGTSGILSGR